MTFLEKCFYTCLNLPGLKPAHFLSNPLTIILANNLTSPGLKTQFCIFLRAYIFSSLAGIYDEKLGAFQCQKFKDFNMQ